MEDKNKKCKYCGTEIEKGVKICPNCKRKQKMAWWQIALIAVGVILMINVIFMPSDSNTTNTEQEVSENENSNKESNKNKGEEKTSYNVGETFSDNYMKVTYAELNDDFKNYSQYATVKDGCKIICASFEFENVSNSDQLASSYNFNCYADGYDCEDFWSTDDATFSANLSAGKKTKGNVYFQVPMDASEVVIEYENNVWSSGKVKFVVK